MRTFLQTISWLIEKLANLFQTSWAPILVPLTVKQLELAFIYSKAENYFSMMKYQVNEYSRIFSRIYPVVRLLLVACPIGIVGKSVLLSKMIKVGVTGQFHFLFCYCYLCLFLFLLSYWEASIKQASNQAVNQAKIIPQSRLQSLCLISRPPTLCKIS